MRTEESTLFLLIMLLGGLWFADFYSQLTGAEFVLFSMAGASLIILGGIFLWDRYSIWGRERRKRRERIREIPHELLNPAIDGVFMGVDEELLIKVRLPDSVRSRHVHILGATGSGKTESVILNFLRQDVARGLGAIILDAKGDFSFLRELRRWVPSQKLRVFDLGDPNSSKYDPLAAGSPLEAAQRLFSSLVWSEEYYKSKALSALQRLFQNHFEANDRNPRLIDLYSYLENPSNFTAVATTRSYPAKLAEKDFAELSGLRDQVRALTIGHLAQVLSPEHSEVRLEDAASGGVLYFRLQSLLSPQMVATLGRLLIGHLGYLAGTAHRGEPVTGTKIVPIYLDEFASFACPEFADLVSKARSAKLALHFSHQSIGDLTEVSEGFLNRITDNSATKIVLRINDPDSAEYLARSFGTRLYQKITQRITNVKELENAEAMGEGSQREAHQFRAAPDLFKTLPTGVGSVLVAHGFETPHGASSVFRIRFPHIQEAI